MSERYVIEWEGLHAEVWTDEDGEAHMEFTADIPSEEAEVLAQRIAKTIGMNPENIAIIEQESSY